MWDVLVWKVGVWNMKMCVEGDGVGCWVWKLRVWNMTMWDV